MPTYRRPIPIPASKLPLHLVGLHRYAPAAGRGRAAKRPLSSPQSTDRPVQLEPEQQSIAFTLPVPPSINHQYATVNGRRLLSSSGRAYKAQVGQLVWLALVNSPHRAVLLSQFQFASL